MHFSTALWRKLKITPEGSVTVRYVGIHLKDSMVSRVKRLTKRYNLFCVL